MTVTNVQTLDRRMTAAARGDARAAFDLGVAYSTGTMGAVLDLVEAHRWFNLAAVAGHPDAPAARGDVSEDMTAREIATAQRLARDWLAQTRRLAA